MAAGAASVQLAAAPAMHAQTVPAELTLERAIEIARARNPSLNRARNSIERATASERSAWGSFLPSVGTRISLSDFSSRTMTAQDDFGQPVALDNPAEFQVTSASGGLGASFRLFNGFGRLNELQASRAGSRAAGAFTDAESQRVEAEVRRRFYDAVAAEDLIVIEERLLAVAEERLEATRAMVVAGRATPQDVLGAEVDVARAQMALENAGASAYTLELRLREVLGIGSDVEFELVGRLPELVDPSALDADSLVRVALGASPLLRGAAAAASRAENMADAARASRWPTITLDAGVNRGIQLPNLNDLAELPWNRGVSFGVSASVPVFTGFALSERIAQATVTRDNAQEDLREMRLAVERNVLIALSNVNSAFRAAQLGRRAAELATLRLDMGQEGFRHGRVSFTVLQQLTNQASQAERTAVSTHTEYARALATLEQAVGRPVVIQ